MSRAFASCFIALIAAIAASSGRSTASSAGGEQVWLVVSDVHLNPFDRRPDPVLFGTDTNLVLFRSALAEMRRQVPNPAVVLLPGDFLTHHFEARARAHAAAPSVADDAIRTMQLIATSFGSAFPHARFAITLGNNDAPCGDYRSALGTAYLTAVARAWSPLVNRAGAAPGFAQSFAAAGHYTAALPVRGMRLIALDDVPLSAQYAGDCAAAAGHSAAGELAWLDSVLAATPPGTRNVVMMHVPPGFDAFSTQQMRGFVIWPFLYGDANRQLLAALSESQNDVVYAIAGHTHRFDFRLDGKLPILVFGSLSPIYHNNPAFFALHVGADGSIRDIDTYAFDEWSQEWQAKRSFDATWHVKQVDAETLAALHARLERDATMRRTYDAASNGWPSNRHVAWGMWEATWRVPWCAQTYLDAGFAQCSGLLGRSAFFRIAAILFVMAAATAAVTLMKIDR